MYYVYDNPTYEVANKLICILYLVSSVLDSLITRLRFARVDGIVSLIYVILCLAVVAQVISSAYFGSISK